MPTESFGEAMRRALGTQLISLPMVPCPSLTCVTTLRAWSSVSFNSSNSGFASATVGSNAHR